MAEYVTLKKPDGTIIYPQTAWDELMTLIEPYKAGDSETFDGNTFMPGYVSNGAVTIYASLILSKKIDASVTTISINAGGDITARGISGYLLNSAVIGTDITIGVAVATSRKEIKLVIKKSDSSAFSVTNNTPVTVIGNFTISFS